MTVRAVKLVALLPLLLGGCAGLALPARPRTPTQPKLVVVRVPLARPRNGTRTVAVTMIAPGEVPEADVSRIAPVSMNADVDVRPAFADAEAARRRIRSRAADAAKALVVDPLRAADAGIQRALDTPLLDPWSEPEACDVEHPLACVPGSEHFKALARNDPDLAEALWASSICGLGLWMGMEAVGCAIRAGL